MKQLTKENVKLQFDENTLQFSIQAGASRWNTCPSFYPKIITADGELLFSSALRIKHMPWKSGLGEGILSHYDGFSWEGKAYSLSFETLCWIEDATGYVHFELIPLKEESLLVKEILWPGPFEFTKASASWYTLINLQQGLMIPNNWKEPLDKLPFGGRMGTADAYMPWFGQIKDGAGYLAICEQYADCGYYVEHPARGPYTLAGIRIYPSLGQIRYRRTFCYEFLEDCDYNDLCKCYRHYTQEHGTFRTLKEKALTAPVDKLVGTSFVHSGIKTHVQPDSRFYDPADPLKNDNLATFERRAKEIRHYHDDLGIEKLYLHLDGWAEPGYDNQHPDYLPACEAAGGWEGMKDLLDTMHDCGYSFGIHDQYRDYYFSAKTFDLDFATRLADGKYPEHANWAGGHQTYLCASQAPAYVKRNFTELMNHGITPDCAYLDVFTCNEGDECSNPRHQMTRQECLKYRGECFSYLLSHGILSSSEEVTDWSIPALVFCHYAPYHFMMEKPGTPKIGIAVPLFNLVYHDCVIIPWMMEKHPTEDYMLYALLNGGAPYFIRNGAYANTDGAFVSEDGITESEAVTRCKEVSTLHEKIAYEEMVSHRFLNEDCTRQQTCFSDGTVVTVDVSAGTYEIQLG